MLKIRTRDAVVNYIDPWNKIFIILLAKSLGFVDKQIKLSDFFVHRSLHSRQVVLGTFHKFVSFGLFILYVENFVPKRVFIFIHADIWILRYLYETFRQK